MWMFNTGTVIWGDASYTALQRGMTGREFLLRRLSPRSLDLCRLRIAAGCKKAAVLLNFKQRNA